VVDQVDDTRVIRLPDTHVHVIDSRNWIGEGRLTAAHQYRDAKENRRSLSHCHVFFPSARKTHFR
jgi:hypothetical protein